VTEYIIAAGKVPFWAKPLIPKALSAAVSGVLMWTGVDPTTAAAAGVSLMGLVKLVNESPLAPELESKFEAERAKLLAASAPAADQKPSTSSSGAETAKAIAMLLFVGAMLLGKAHAGVSFGAVSPTASGPRLLEFQPLVTATFYRVGAGAVLQPSIDTLGGITVTENWGNYSLGLAGALDKDTSNGNFYLAGGVVAGILPYGMVEAFWKANGCILGYTMPIGVGASVQ
jgi:hypothetical protein